MKDMRQLINLMEGVMAVPGVGVQPQGSESDMQTAGTVGRNQAYAEFDASQGPVTEKSGNDVEDAIQWAQKRYKSYTDHGMNDEQAKVHISDELKTHNVLSPEEISMVVDKAFPGPVSEDKMEYSEEVRQALADFKNMTSNFFMDGDTAYEKIVQNLSDEVAISEFDKALEDLKLMSYDNEADDVKSPEVANLDFDSDEFDDISGEIDHYRGHDEFEEAFNLQNGYDDINDASGNDYFPNGADGPVVKAVGPSGARQGDNPEQKKMQVAEVHKELVYGYRNFLSEQADTKKKS